MAGLSMRGRDEEDAVDDDDVEDTFVSFAAVAAEDEAPTFRFPAMRSKLIWADLGRAGGAADDDNWGELHKC